MPQVDGGSPLGEGRRGTAWGWVQPVWREVQPGRARDMPPGTARDMPRGCGSTAAGRANYPEDHLPVRLAHVAHGHRHVARTSVDHRTGVAHTRVEDQQVGAQPNAPRVLRAEKAWHWVPCVGGAADTRAPLGTCAGPNRTLGASSMRYTTVSLRYGMPPFGSRSRTRRWCGSTLAGLVGTNMCSSVDNCAASTSSAARRWPS